AKDAAGNGTLASNALKVSVVAKGPTPLITSTAPPVISKPNAQVTVSFPRSVTGFTAADVVVGNGTITNFTGSGSTYSFTLQPLTAATSAAQTVTVSVPAGPATDRRRHPRT